MKLLLTRAQPDCERLKTALAEHSIECMSAPLLTIKATGQAPEDGVHLDAVVATSRHAFIDQTPLSLPLYVVGQATADAAQAQGWSPADIVAKDAETLIESIDLAAGSSLLYLRGEHISTNLCAALPDYRWYEVITYSAEALALSPDILSQLTNGSIQAVAFFSKRTAELFEQQLGQQKLPPLQAFCLSEAIASTLKHPCWQRKTIAQIPSEASLIDALQKAAYS